MLILRKENRGMNSAITFFVGCVTFVMMMGIKHPIKRIIFSLTKYFVLDLEKQYIAYKRWNVLLLPITVVVAAICYYFVLKVMAIEHFKWCCSLKAGAIAIAIYAVYEQWFEEGWEGDINEEE